MEIDSFDKDGVSIIVINGHLDASNAHQLKTKFNEFAFKQQNFVMDLSGMNYIDSTGLGSLVSCLRTVSDSGGGLKVCGLREKPKMLFEITKAYKIFEVFNDLDSALASFHRAN